MAPVVTARPNAPLRSGFVASLLLLAVVFGGRGALAVPGEWADDSFDSLPEPQRKSMPNKDDPAMLERLRCSACHWCVVELHSDVIALERQFNKTRGDASKTTKKKKKARDEPDQDKVDEVIDELCDRHYPDYGLHVDAETNTVKPKYTKLAGRIQGAWVTRVFQNTCSEFVAQFQDDDRKRTWRYMRRELWGSQNNIAEDKFLSLCPPCRTPAGKAGFPSRAETLMWVDEKTRIEEDWDL